MNPCPDCEQTPCKCEEWQRELDRADAEEAERLASFAETMMPELWTEGPGGLLVRRK